MAAEKRITASEKEIYSGISKFGKALDKTFKTSSGLSNGESSPSVLEEPQYRGLVDRAVLMHLARSGEFDVASTFMREATLSVPANLLSDFSNMYKIVRAIHERRLGPAIEWASQKRAELLDRGSNLEFTLHKLEFVRYLVAERDTAAALAYAQTHLAVFADRYLDEISRLMAAILYVDRGLERSPYADVLTSPTYEQAHAMFASEFCSLLGLPPQSPLYLAVTTGSIALPILTKMESVMKARGAEWTTSQELPVEIPLPSLLEFHNIFVCPVSKEQTTEENPPMMLQCGHILATNSVRSLGKDNPHHMFKCPYCPQETNLAQSRRVYV